MRHFRDFYATRRRPTVTRFRAEVAADCRREGLAVPSIRRLRRWLDRHDEAELLRRREGKGKSEAVFLATPGKLEADAPLAIVQIDHTKVDVTVVDPVTRLAHWPADADAGDRRQHAHGARLPSFARTALADGGRAVSDPCGDGQDRNGWRLGGSRPNGWRAEFPASFTSTTAPNFMRRPSSAPARNTALILFYRPPGTPRFGGHIERLIGTAMGAVHLIPGSHFSNVRERGDLDPERRAVMTLGELETYFALEIVGAYHARIHRALEAPPVSVWRARIGEVAVRMPEDPRRFLIDFLPAEQRVLRRDGLHLHHIRYWADELRWLVGRGSEKFTVKYDPRDSRWSSCGSRRGIWKRDRRIERGRPSRFGSTARRCGLCARRGAARSTRS